MTLEHVYRFRPLARLLDQGELQDQQIYFASPEELNDPMEGFRDVVWQGDKVLWANLLRHYVRCLHHACVLLMISGEDYPVTWDMIPLFRADKRTTPEAQAKTTQLLNRVLKHQEIEQLVTALASRTVPIRRAELAAVLRHLHLIAITTFNGEYTSQQNSPAPKQSLPGPNAIEDLLKGVAEITESVLLAEKEGQKRDAIVAAIFDAVGHTGEQLQFIYDYNDDLLHNLPNRRMVLVEFPSEYVKRLEDLVYPRWYAACFMSECRDPSVWGTYGDGHKSVCLKFKVHDVDGVPALRIRRKNGYSNGGDIISLVRDRLNPITYDSKPPQIDFFRTIGRLPKAVIEREWFTDQNGTASAVQHGVMSDEKTWQDAYWQNFISSITRKLTHWKSENEYRLILDNMFWNLAESKDRVTHYEFADLDGIIFGIRTPLQEKKKLCKIIEEKCAAIGRSDFKFYQAYYSPTTGQVEHAEMSLLKFTAGPKKEAS